MPYPSDVTDAEWVKLEPLLPGHPAKGRPWLWDLREYLNAIFYVLGNQCPWRALPLEYPPWQSVYSRFRLWQRKGTWARLMEALGTKGSNNGLDRDRRRRGRGRLPLATAGARQPRNPSLKSRRWQEPRP